MKKIFYCPVNGYDCPYFREDNTCFLTEMHEDPVRECDDAAAIYDEEDDYFMYRDEDGKEYDALTLFKMRYNFSDEEACHLYFSEEDIKGHL